MKYFTSEKVQNSCRVLCLSTYPTLKNTHLTRLSPPPPVIFLVEEECVEMTPKYFPRPPNAATTSRQRDVVCECSMKRILSCNTAHILFIRFELRSHHSTNPLNAWKRKRGAFPPLMAPYCTESPKCRAHRPSVRRLSQYKKLRICETVERLAFFYCFDYSTEGLPTKAGGRQLLKLLRSLGFHSVTSISFFDGARRCLQFRRLAQEMGKAARRNFHALPCFN